MAVYKETIPVKSHGKTPSYIDVTPMVREAVKKSGIKEGVVNVISPHTTCSVFFEEFAHDTVESGDDFLQADLNDVLSNLFPDQVDNSHYRYPGQMHYDAVRAWDSWKTYLPNEHISDLYNGEAHLKATLLGSSQAFEVDAGELAVPITGYIYFVDFDRTRERERKCKVIVIGE